MLTELIIAFIRTLRLVVDIYQYVIFIYIILTWIPEIRSTRFFDILNRICDPFLRIFDRIIPPIGGLSISAILAILTLRLLQWSLGQVLYQLIELY